MSIHNPQPELSRNPASFNKNIEEDPKKGIINNLANVGIIMNYTMITKVKDASKTFQGDVEMKLNIQMITQRYNISIILII